MSSALEEFARETMDELAKKLPLEKRLELLREIPLDKRLEVLNELPLEKRLEVLKGLSGEQIRRVVPVEKLLEGLSPGERADLAKKLLANGSGPTSH